MNWAEVLIPLATGLLGALGGALLGPHLKGKPPASPKVWDQIDADAATRREARRP